MGKAESFLLKIQSKNKLRALLKEKKASYSKLVNVPEALDECIRLKKEIDSIEFELSGYN